MATSKPQKAKNTRRGLARDANGAAIGLVDNLIHAVKERIQRYLEDFEPVFLKTTQAEDRYQNLAA